MLKRIIFFLLPIFFVMIVKSEEPSEGGFDPTAYVQQKGCRLRGMVGRAPEEVCSQIIYLTRLPKFDPKNKVRCGTNSLLFYGKPGTGKSLTAECMAMEAGSTLRKYSFLDLSKEPCKYPDKLDEIYKEAKKTVEEKGQPVIILLEDIELVDESYALILRSCLDRYFKNPYIITVLIVQKKNSLPDDLRERFCNHIYFDTPDKETRAALIKMTARENKVELSDALVNSMALLSVKYTANDINKAFKKVLSKSCENQEQPVDKVRLFYELTKPFCYSTGFAMFASICFIYGVRSGKLPELIHKIYVHFAKKPLTTNNVAVNNTGKAHDSKK